MANPVGTGPYRLKEWRRGQKIVLEANPGFRDELFPGEQRSRGSRDRREACAARSCRWSVASRSASSRNRIRACSRSSSGDLDYVAVPPDLVAQRARPGQQAEAATSPSRASRSRAASSRRSRTRTSTWRIRSSAATRNGQDRAAPRDRHGLQRRRGDPRHPPGPGEPATQPMPPNMSPATTRSSTARPSTIRPRRKALLDKFGYVDRDGDGWRDLPDGKPLRSCSRRRRRRARPAAGRAVAAQPDGVGLRVEFVKQKWPTCSRWHGSASCRCGSSATSARRPRASAFSGCSTAARGVLQPARFKLPEFDRALRAGAGDARQARANEAPPAGCRSS